jgi:hypothetical protein
MVISDGYFDSCAAAASVFFHMAERAIVIHFHILLLTRAIEAPGGKNAIGAAGHTIGAPHVVCRKDYWQIFIFSLG